jgi:Tir chaperone protein (CesT) family
MPATTPFVDSLRAVLLQLGVSNTAEAVCAGASFNLDGQPFTVQYDADGALAETVVLKLALGPAPTASQLDTYRLLLRSNTLAASQGSPTFGLQLDTPDIVMMARLPTALADVKALTDTLLTMQGLGSVWRDTRCFTHAPAPAA